MDFAGDGPHAGADLVDFLPPLKTANGMIPNKQKSLPSGLMSIDNSIGARYLRHFAMARRKTSDPFKGFVNQETLEAA